LRRKACRPLSWRLPRTASVNLSDDCRFDTLATMEEHTLNTPKAAEKAKSVARKLSVAAEIKVHCNQCAHETIHDRIRVPYEPSVPSGKFVSWQLIECRGCRDVASYRVETEDESGVSIAQVHPLRQFRRTNEFNDIRPTLQAIYEETIGAFNSSFPRLCAGGLRAVVEGICDDQQIVDGPIPGAKNGQRSDSLAARIEGLAEANILTSRQAKALHEHRVFGNDSLHNLAEHDREILGKLIDVVERILYDLYSLPEITEGLRKKRSTGR
jgi:Domain of unknown function (DUF4145)